MLFRLPRGRPLLTQHLCLFVASKESSNESLDYMIRRPILALVAAITFASEAAGDPQLCRSIPLDSNTGQFGLYYRNGSGASQWIRAADLIGQPATPSRGSIRFALVIHPFPPRSGVLDIRVRTEAIGSQPDASWVTAQPDAVNEPCAPGGRVYHLRPYNRAIPTRIYEDYHNPNSRVEYSDLDRFHFYYKPDQGQCVYTNDPNRSSSFRFSSIPGESPTGMGVGDIARGVNPPELNTPVAFISRSIGRAVAAVYPRQSQPAGPPGSAPTPTHYTKLASLLRKYDSRVTGQDCIGFDLIPSANEVATYISITDFDAAPFLASSFFTDHWEINWQSH